MDKENRVGFKSTKQDKDGRAPHPLSNVVIAAQSQHVEETPAAAQACNEDSEQCPPSPHAQALRSFEDERLVPPRSPSLRVSFAIPVPAPANQSEASPSAESPTDSSSSHIQSLDSNGDASPGARGKHSEAYWVAQHACNIDVSQQYHIGRRLINMMESRQVTQSINRTMQSAPRGRKRKHEIDSNMPLRHFAWLNHKIISMAETARTVASRCLGRVPHGHDGEELLVHMVHLNRLQANNGSPKIQRRDNPDEDERVAKAYADWYDEWLDDEKEFGDVEVEDVEEDVEMADADEDEEAEDYIQ